MALRRRKSRKDSNFSKGKAARQVAEKIEPPIARQRLSESDRPAFLAPHAFGRRNWRV
jgi:hypothetical protein